MPTEGTLSLYIGDEKVGEGKIKTQPGKFSLPGEGLNVGKDSGEPVTADFPGSSPWAFVGGTVHKAVIDVSGEPFVDLAEHGERLERRLRRRSRIAARHPGLKRHCVIRSKFRTASSAGTAPRCAHATTGFLLRAANDRFQSPLSRLSRQPEMPFYRHFESGSDGTRTRDLRRDRPVMAVAG